MARRLVRPGTDFPVRREIKKKEPHVKERADKLHASGMPFQMAMAVAYGKLDLNEALERMARTDRIEALMKRHDLSRALATQIALGQASLERVLYRRRFDDHRRDFRDRSVLDESVESQELISLALHGDRFVTGRVVSVERYTLVFHEEGQDEPNEIHKLQVKYAFAPDAAKRVEKVIEFDPEMQNDPEDPIERPQDRYACSDKRLFHYLDGELDVVATLLEGELVVGKVSWFSRYEFGVRVGEEELATIFRHALFHLREV